MLSLSRLAAPRQDRHLVILSAPSCLRPVGEGRPTTREHARGEEGWVRVDVVASLMCLVSVCMRTEVDSRGGGARKPGCVLCCCFSYSLFPSTHRKPVVTRPSTTKKRAASKKKKKACCVCVCVMKQRKKKIILGTNPAGRGWGGGGGDGVPVLPI